MQPEDSGTAAQELDDTTVVTFIRPIDLGGVQYASVELTEPTYAQLRAAEKAPTALEQVAVLLQQNGKLPNKVVDQLRQRDIQAAANFFSRFGNASLPTSETSWPT